MKITDRTVVTVDYTLKDNKGEIIDSSEESGSFTYIQGMDETLPGMEEILEGKEEGFTYDGIIPCEKAYGKRDEDYFIPVPKEEFKHIDEFIIGSKITIVNSYDEEQEMEIVAVDEDNITIDANNPFVDMDIAFTCKVLEVREATKEEIDEALEEHEHDCDCGNH